MPNFSSSVGGLAPDANELYYNILIKNNAVVPPNLNTSSLPGIPVSFQETRSNPYIQNPSDYYMSVISFECDTQSTPTFVCDAVVGSNNINDTIYFVSMEDSLGNVQTINVTWQPENNTIAQPPIPVPNNYSSYPYYYAYSYSWFINLVNNTLSTAYSAIGGTTYAPFIQLKDGIVSIIASEAEFGSNSTVYYLYFNTALYELFSSFTYNYIVDTGNLGINYQVIFSPTPSGSNVIQVPSVLSTVPPSSPYQAIENVADYSPLPYWNPVDSIVFTTQQLYVVPELIAKPTLYGNNTSQYLGVNANISYILADYAGPLISGTEYKPRISYVPIAEFRLVDLYSIEPIRALQIDVFWKDTFGVLHPLLLLTGGSAYIKIMFRKKTFYD